jgi:hypothetical protein
MKTFLIALGTIVLAILLVAGGTWLGVTWAQGRWANNPMGPGMMGTTWDEGGQGNGAPGWGMMGRGWQDMPCDKVYANPSDSSITSLGEAEEAIDNYVRRLGYTGLHVTEVMEFERNYYAIAAEEETGIGAMELLMDKRSGAVGPEPGPNMMWNARYGMMGQGDGMMGMMGDYATDEMALSSEEAQDVAQRWLDTNMRGRTAGEADPFYGYYTLHFLSDGEIEGMLSVHSSTGDVWYHSWHGDFVTMMESHG